MPMSSNRRPTANTSASKEIEAPLTPPTIVSAGPALPPATEAPGKALRGGSRRAGATRPGYVSAADLYRDHGRPANEPQPVVEPTHPSPTQEHRVSTEPAFWEDRFPKLLDATEKRWGTRARFGLEMAGGVHHELLEWSLRATDSVWGSAVEAMRRASQEPGSVARYMCGVLRRSVPASEKARRGDAVVPVQQVALPATAPTQSPVPPRPYRRRTLADFMREHGALASDPESCNLSGADGRPQRAKDDRDHGCDRHYDGLLAAGVRRSG